MKNLRIHNLTEVNAWDAENLFHWKTNTLRWEKYVSQYEIIKKAPLDKGIILEIGVHKLCSLLRIAHFRDILGYSESSIFGFDFFDKFELSKSSNVSSDQSFIDDFERKTGGALKLNEANKILEINDLKNISLVKGDIFSTLKEFFDLNQFTISFLHIDVDVYPPTLFSLQKSLEFCCSGSIIMLDDYSHVDGATQAVDEFLRDNNNLKLQQKGSLRPVTYIQIP